MHILRQQEEHAPEGSALNRGLCIQVVTAIAENQLKVYMPIVYIRVSNHLLPVVDLNIDVPYIF